MVAFPGIAPHLVGYLVSGKGGTLPIWVPNHGIVPRGNCTEHTNTNC